MKKQLFTPILTSLLLLFGYASLYAQSCAEPDGSIFVTTADDEGPGSLREAIICANAEPGPNIIRFSIQPFGQNITIFVGETSGEALPTLTDAETTIDGTTQPGWSTGGDLTPVIILDGSQHNWTFPINALFIQGSGCRIFGLEIRNFPDDGIDVYQANNVRIGDQFKMNIIYSCGAPIDTFPDFPNLGPWEGCGIVLRNGANNCVVQNNIIGTNEFLEPGLGNEWCGISNRASANFNTIGANNQNRDNIIFGNPVGIRIDNSIGVITLRNEYICNDSAGIELVNNANANIAPPEITNATPTQISGTGGNAQTVQVYLSNTSDCPGAACQGRVFLGETPVVGGTWTLSAPFAGGVTVSNGDVVTANVFNFNNNSSAFAACFPVIDLNTCIDTSGIAWVTNTDDEGDGSLRQAILCANEDPAPNEIRFNIPGNGPHTIFVGSTSLIGLPTLIDPHTVIDATSQPGYGDNGEFRPQIILDGSQHEWTFPYNALFVQADHAEIYGLEIVHFPDDGIDVTGADSVIVGAPGKGNVIYNNGLPQDFFPDLPGTGPWDGCGIVLKNNATNCTVQSNIIGTNYDQTIEGGNEFCGIIVQNGGSNHTIGGNTEEANVVAYNASGIILTSSSNNVRFFQNQLFCNDTVAISLLGAANNNQQAPVIDTASVDMIMGTSAPDQIIDVYIQELCDSNEVCQGKTYLGTTVSPTGSWMLQPPFANGVELNLDEVVVAIASDGDNNSSEYSNCMEVQANCAIAINIDTLSEDSCLTGVGAFAVSPLGGNAPFTYDIGDGPEAIPLFDSLVAGDYMLTVTDDIGCTLQQTVTVSSMGGFPEASFEGNANDLEVTFDNLTIDGNSFEWEFGDDSTSTDTIPVHVYPGTGAYEVCLTATGDCAVDTFCETLVVFDADDRVIFDVGEFQVDTVNSDTFSVPVFVENFRDMVGFQFSVNLNQPGAYFAGTTDFNLPNFTADNFMVDDQLMTCSWVDFSFQGEDLPDSSILFSVLVAFEEGYGGCWEIEISGEPTPIEVVRVIEGEDALAPFETVAGAICRPVTVNGTVRREDNVNVGQVIVNMSDTTGADGQYELTLDTNGDTLMITPHKNINPNNGVTGFDLVLIQQHILFVELLNSPYKIIAADVDQSGFVSTFDITIIQRVILGLFLEFPNADSWRFVPHAFSFTDPMDPFFDDFPEAISLIRSNGLFDVTTADLDFVGIKTGDVTVDNNPLNLTAPEPVFLTLSAPLEQDNGFWLLPVGVNSNQPLSALQGTLEWPMLDLEIEDVIPGDQITTNNLNKSQLEDGRFSFVWWDQDASSEGIAFDPAESLFYLKIKGDIAAIDLLALTNSLTFTQAFDPSGTAYPLELQTMQATAVVDENTEVNVGLPQPNPFSTSFFIPMTLDQAQEIQLNLYDATGQRLRSAVSERAVGNQLMEIPMQPFPSGVYWYELIIGEKVWSGKVVKE